MADILPPIPYDKPQTSFEWIDWYTKLIDLVNSGTQHNQLPGLQGGTSGEYYHITNAQLTTVQNAITKDQTVAAINEQGFQINGDWVWHDMLGPIEVRGVGVNDPVWAVYRAGIRQYQFGLNDEVWLCFHIPHDYLPGSDMHIHAHWSHTATTVTGGSVTWGFEATYAKGHNQAAFSAPVTRTILQNASTTQYQHMIAETQLTAATPAVSQIDSDLIEVDGLLLVRCYLSANAMTVSGGGVPDPFLHTVDIHYQSTNVGTKNKAPSFYT